MSLSDITALIYIVGIFLSIAIVVVIASWNHKEEDDEIGDIVFGSIPVCVIWPFVILFVCVSAPFFLLSKFIKKVTCNG